MTKRKSGFLENNLPKTIKPSAAELMSKILKTMKTGQMLIENTLEVVNSGEGDIEKNRAFYDATESAVYLMLNNLCVSVHEYVQAMRDEELLNDKYLSPMFKNVEFMEAFTRFKMGHRNFMNRSRVKEILERDAQNSKD